jgi:alcohol dehydrogenase
MTTSTNWNYHSPVRIAFGVGVLGDLPSLTRAVRTLLVMGSFPNRVGLGDRLKQLLGNHLKGVLDNVRSNPTLDQLEGSARKLSAELPEVLVAVGGGSVLDTAKVLSFLLPSIRCGFSLRQHFERQLPLPEILPLPVVAIPTTAGTGSEVTPFATVWDPPRGKKYSLALPMLFPRSALLDPGLTLGLPTDPTISSALDALSHGLESIWNRNASPMTLLQGARAVALVLQTLPKLLAEPDNISLRSLMLEAGLWGGLAISNAKTALAHSMSYPITARLDLPHGLACSFTLPALLGFNAASDDGRLARLAGFLGHSSIGALRAELIDFLNHAGVNAALKRHSIHGSTLRALMPEMLTPNRSNNNLRAANHEDLAKIITDTESYFPALKD